MRALIYTRASLDHSGEGKSNARQEDECVRLCEYKRWEVTAKLGDYSISAYGDKKRPAWEQALKMIEAGEVDVIVAYHLDRLTRNMADLERLIILCEEHGVTVTTATGDLDLSNDTGRMVARILAAVARQEVERKAARQRLAHAQRRAEGKPWKATKILGYDRDGNIIEEEANAIRQAVQDVIADRATVGAIMRRFQDLGFTTPHGGRRRDGNKSTNDKPWSRSGVRQILMHPRMAGYITYGGFNGEIIGKGDWEPIITDTDLTLITAKLTDPSRRRGPKGSNGIPQNLLTGIMRCAICDTTVRASVDNGKKTYRCVNSHVRVPRDESDELVRSAFALAVATTTPGVVLGGTTTEADGSMIEEQIAELRARQDALAVSLAKGLVTPGAYSSAAEDIGSQIKEYEERLIAAPPVDPYAVRTEAVHDFLARDLVEQRRILEKLAVVTLHPVARNEKGGRLSNMSAQHQVRVDVRGRRGESEILIPAFAPKTTGAPSNV